MLSIFSTVQSLVRPSAKPAVPERGRPANHAGLRQGEIDQQYLRGQCAKSTEVKLSRGVAAGNRPQDRFEE